MFRMKLLLLVLVFCLGSGSLAFGQSVTLDSTYGIIDFADWPNLTLVLNQKIEFYFRYTNDLAAPIPGGTNGFRIYSPDGATWDTTEIDTVELSFSYWNLVLNTYSFSCDGQGADTVGVGGSKMIGDGIPAGWDEVAVKITVGPIPSSSKFKWICLDSCFYPPSGLWKWTYGGEIGAVVPDWDGPYCYEVSWWSDIDLDGVHDASDN